MSRKGINYSYTGVNTGTATLTITSRAKTAKGKKLSTELEVTVINPFKATQTAADKFTISTSDKLEKVEKADIKVVQEGNTIDNAVKSIKISEDKMSAEITMEIPFVDQKKYEITFGKEKDSFVASVGKPAAINIKTQSVVINKPTEVEFAVVDEKGIDVTSVTDKSKLTLDVKVKNGYYDTANKKLTLWKVGDTAEVTATYHTWTYDTTTGKENVVEAKATITAVDKSSVTVTGLDKWTIADNVLSWDTDTMVTMMPKNTNSNIWVRMKKSDGTYVNNKDNKNDFKFEVINSTILYVTSEGKALATGEGVAYAKVTYYDGTVQYQYTLPVTVGAAAKATTLVLSQSYVVVAKDTSVGTEFTLKVLDQYGKDFKAAGFTYSKLSGDDIATITAGESGKAYKLTAKSNKTGTGVYELKANDLKIAVTISSQDVQNAAKGYELRAAKNEFTATLIKETSAADAGEIAKGVRLDLFETKNGLSTEIANAKLDGAKFTINGAAVTPAEGTKFAKNVDGSFTLYPVIEVTNALKKSYVSLMGAGAYTIKAEFKVDGKDYVSATTIVVKNETAAAVKDTSYTVEKVEITATDMSVNAIASAAIKSKVEGTLDVKLTDAVYQNVTEIAGTQGANLALITGNNNVAVTASPVRLNTAALPSFKLNEGGALVWVVTRIPNGQAVDMTKKNVSVGNAGTVTFGADASATETAIVGSDVTGLAGGQNLLFDASKSTVTVKNGTGYADMASLGKWSITGTDSSNWKLKTANNNNAASTQAVVVTVTLVGVSGTVQDATTYQVPSTISFDVAVTLQH